MIKVSVIIPVYNVEKYLRQCLDSVANQTLRDIEVICVDDGSTDSSPAILAEYATKDARFKAVYQPNSGTVIARKLAVAASTGDYLLFLDPDDWLEPTALATIAAELEKRPVDILQYGAKIHETSNRSAEARQVTETYFNRELPDADGAEMLKAIYLERTMSWGLITRVVSNQLAKPAFAAMPQVRMINSTDLLATFYLVVRARSFHRISDRLYNYRYGSGISTQRWLSVEDFVRASRKLEALLPLKEYVEHKFPNNEQVHKAYAAVDRIMVDSTLIAFNRRLRDDCDRMAALTAMSHASEVRHVAMMYHWLGFGGVQNVIVATAKALIKQGCRVTFLIEHPISQVGFQLPQGVEVAIIPPSARFLEYDCERRRAALRRIIAERKIDVVYSHSYNSVAISDDALTCRLLCRIPFVVHFHTSFSAYYLRPVLRRRIKDVTAGLKLASSVIVLSRTDELYFRLQGVRANYLPNQLDYHHPADNGRRNKLIVWCGRLSDEKRPIEAIRVFAKVHRQEPSARLLILGSGDDRVFVSLRKEADALKIADYVEMPGFVNNPQMYYSQARVFLSTSEVEGFPMAVAEALGNGLPIVSYALPYLELFDGNDAVFQVPQLDSDAAACKIFDLLKLADAEYAELSRAASESTRRFCLADYGVRLRALLTMNDGTLRAEELSSLNGARLAFIVSTMRNAVVDCANGKQVIVKETVKDLLSGSNWVTRKLVGGMRCLDENGVRYTVRHAIGKICRLAGISCGW